MKFELSSRDRLFELWMIVGCFLADSMNRDNKMLYFSYPALSHGIFSPYLENKIFFPLYR